MGKKKKDTIELRFYEIPQNEYVLALLGENWIRDYGHDEVHLHFHNLMEIGVCRNGTGKLILDEEQRPYQPAMLKFLLILSDLQMHQSLSGKHLLLYQISDRFFLLHPWNDMPVKILFHSLQNDAM